jgi:hypothetical protein
MIAAIIAIRNTNSTLASDRSSQRRATHDTNRAPRAELGADGCWLRRSYLGGSLLGVTQDADGMSFSAIAAALGLTRGRGATQIHSADGTPPERAIFGVSV